MTRRFKALQVEEASLKDPLGQSHAEKSKLCQEMANLQKSLQVEEAKGMLTELARMQTKDELDATAQCGKRSTWGEWRGESANGGINRRCWSCQFRPLPPEDRTSCEGLGMYMNSVQSGKVSCYPHSGSYGSKGRADYKWEREPGANSPSTNYHRGQVSFPPGSQVHQSRGGGCCGTEKNPVEI